MNINCCYKTSLKIDNLFLPGWKWSAPKDKIYEILRDSVPIQENWIDYLISIGLDYQLNLSFFTMHTKSDEFFNYPISHIDLNHNSKTPSVNPSLNIIFGGKGSKMQWYKTPFYKPEDIRITPAGTPYIEFFTNTLEKIEEYELDSTCLYLVRTDIPHNILISKDPRFCVSLRLGKVGETWAEVVNWFKNKNLIVV
jgi:hypothetical protein